MISINSDTLIPIEQHFRVSAGPGAGKTYWLVKHIKNVLYNSKRLMKTRKVACITYTNIAVDTILKRLGDGTSRVEVSTIHSFLYKHVIKPYASFLIDDYGLNAVELNGHDDLVLHFKKITEWIENHPQASQLKNPYTINQLTKLDNNKKALIGWLSSLSYKMDDSNNLVITGNKKKAFYTEEISGRQQRRYLSNKCLDILETNLLEYKKLYWQEGLIDHDDVLFFSYQLLIKYPFILKVLQAKFPYFFVDEFQDTNPIQVSILKLIGNKETIIGVIGDEAQSIYAFQGADPKQFRCFGLECMIDYEIADNRRSTNQIIDILNKIRVDIVQNKIRNVDGEKPIILVGERVLALRKAIEYSNNEPVYSLSRANITSNIMKKEIECKSLNDTLIDELSDIDKSSNSNHYRSRVVISCLKATELSREGKFKDAIKELEQLFKDKHDRNKGKKEALKYLCLLLKKYDEFKDKSLFDFYSFVKREIKSDISNFRDGAPKTFYEQNSYLRLALCVKIDEDISKNKTIHKAKGDEFNNVLVILNNVEDLEFIFKPDLYNNEEHRIYYVAISRAREKLFINIPSLPKNNLVKLKEVFNIIEV